MYNNIIKIYNFFSLTDEGMNRVQKNWIVVFYVQHGYLLKNKIYCLTFVDLDFNRYFLKNAFND